MRANEPRCGIAHGLLVEWKRIVEDVTPDHWRHNSPSIQPIAVCLASRGPARIEVWADFLRCNDSNRGRRQRVQRVWSIECRKLGLAVRTADVTERGNGRHRPPSKMQKHV